VLAGEAVGEGTGGVETGLMGVWAIASGLKSWAIESSLRSQKMGERVRRMPRAERVNAGRVMGVR
jgi:hypothetical protein